MKFNMFCNCTKFAIIVSRFYYEGNNFKPCLLNSQKVELKSNLANPDRLCRMASMSSIATRLLLTNQRDR